MLFKPTGWVLDFLTPYALMQERGDTALGRLVQLLALAAR